MSSKTIESSIVETARRLEVAIGQHVKWLESLHRTLVCDEPLREDMLADNPHATCQFEQWHASAVNGPLRGDPQFETLLSLHRTTHASGHALALAWRKQRPIDTATYNEFLKNQGRLTRTLSALRQALVGSAQQTDPLTSLVLRAPFAMLLNKTHETAVRGGPPYTVGLFDLDRFGKLTDEHGRGAADALLRAVADSFVRDLRSADTVCRFGGDQFAVLFAATELEAAMEVSERSRATIEEIRVLSKSSRRMVGVTTSAGVAQWSRHVRADDCMKRSEQALHACKQGERNQVLAWSPEHVPASGSQSQLGSPA